MKPPGNPYRAILRRDYPEPLIALLAFILGIWLWDHYFGKIEGYAPGTEEIALVKIDRDLRLADAMEEDPQWLKWLAGVDEPAAARRQALEVFQKLAAEKSISPQGLEAFAIVKSVQEGLPMRTTLGQVLPGGMISEFAGNLRRSSPTIRGTWWHAKLIESWEETTPPGSTLAAELRAGWHSFENPCRGGEIDDLAAGFVGLAFVPSALRCLKRGLTAKTAGYAVRGRCRSGWWFSSWRHWRGSDSA